MSKTYIDMVDDEDEPVITRGAGGKAPAHLSQFIDDEADVEDCEGGGCSFCGLVNCRCAYDIDAQGESDGEQPLSIEEEEHPNPSKRGSKACPIHLEEEGDDPDLAAYFDQYQLTEQQQIAMCRTYANYLSQKVRSTAKMRGRPYTVRGGGSGPSTGSANMSKKWKRIKIRQPVFEDEQE